MIVDVIFTVLAVAFVALNAYAFARTPRCPQCRGKFWSRRAPELWRSRVPIRVLASGPGALCRCLACELAGRPILWAA